MSKTTISGLFDVSRLNALLDKFSSTYGVNATIYDTASNAITIEYPDAPICQTLKAGLGPGIVFCGAHRQTHTTMAASRYFVGSCPCGLMSECASAIHLDGAALGVISVGGVTSASPSPDVDELIGEMATEAGVDIEDAANMFRNTRRLTPAQLDLVGQACLAISQFLTEQASINNVRRQQLRSEAVRERTQQLLQAKDRQDWAEHLHEALFDPHRKTRPWNTPAAMVLLMYSVIMPFIAGLACAASHSAAFRAVYDHLSLIFIPASSAVIGPYTTPVVSWAFVSAFVLLPLLLTFHAARTRRAKTVKLFRPVLRMGSIVHIYVVLVPIYASVGVYLALAPAYRFLADTSPSPSSVIQVIILTITSLLLLSLGLWYNIIHSAAVNSPPVWYSLYPSQWLSVSISTMVCQVLLGAAVGLGAKDLGTEDEEDRLTFLFYAAIVGFIGAVVSGNRALATFTNTPINTIGSVVAVSSMVSAMISCGLVSVLSFAQLVVTSDSTPLAFLFALVGAVSCAIIPLSAYLTFLRIRYCEQLVFAVILGDGHICTRPIDVLRTIVLHPKARSAVIQQLALNPPATLGRADLMGLSVKTIEVGTRPLCAYRGVVAHGNGLGEAAGPSCATQRANTVKLALKIFRQACAQYDSRTTIALRMAQIKFGVQVPDMIDSAQQMWEIIKMDYFTEMTPSNRIMVTGIEAYIEHMQFIHALDGEDKASAYLSTQKMLADAREQHLRTLVRMSKLWPVVLASQMNIVQFTTLVQSVGKSALKANALYSALHRRNPADPLVAEWYCLFLDTVLQDHAAAQRMRSESSSSESSPSTAPTSVSSVGSVATAAISTKEHMRGPVRIIRVSLTFTALVVLLQVLIGCILGMLVFIHQFGMEQVEIVHDASHALHLGTLAALATQLNDSSSYFSDGWPDIASTLDSAIATISNIEDDLLAVESTMDLSSLVFIAHDTCPVTLSVASSSLTTLTSAVKDALQHVLDSGVSDDATSHSLSLNGARMLLPAFRVLLGAIYSNMSSAIAFIAVLFLLLILAEIAALTSLAFWLNTQLFPSVTKHCDDVVGRCLLVSDIQIRRKIRLTFIARESFKDITLADDDGYRPDVAHFTPEAMEDQAAGNGENKGTIKDFPDSADDSMMGDMQATPIGTGARRVVFADTPDEIVHIAPESGSESSTSSSEVSLFDPLIGLEEMQLDISDLDGFIAAVQDSDTSASRADSDGSMSELDAAIRRPAHPRARQSSGIAAALKYRFRRLKGVGLGRPGLIVVATALAVVSVAISAVCLSLGLTGRYGSWSEARWADLGDHMEVDIAPLVKTEALIDFHLPRFVKGSYDSFKYVDIKAFGDAIDKAIEVNHVIPSIGSGRSMARFIEDMSRRRHDHIIAVILAGQGYGLASVDIPGFAWNYSAEGSSEIRSERFGRTLWYSDKAYDLALNSTTQLAIAQAIVYDQQQADWLKAGVAALKGLADTLEAETESLIDRSLTLDFAMLVAPPVVQLLLVAAIFVLLNVVWPERRLGQTVNAGLLTVAAIVLCHLVFEVGLIVGAEYLEIDSDFLDIAQERTSLAHIIAVTSDALYHTQRVVATGSESAVTHTSRALAELEILLAAHNTIGETFLSHAEGIYTAATVAARLAVSVHDPDDTTFSTVTWDVLSGRERDTGRFTNSTFDLTLPDSTKLGMAWDLVLSDKIIASDMGRMLDAAQDMQTMARNRAARTVAWCSTVISINRQAVVFAFALVPIVIFVAIVIPGILIGTAHRGFSRHQEKRVSDLAGTLRPLLSGCVRVVALYAMLTLPAFAVVFIGNIAILRMNANLIDVASLNAVALAGASQAIVADTGSPIERDVSPVTRSLASLARDIPSLYANAWDNPFVAYTASGLDVDRIPTLFAAYHADMTMFTEIAPKYENSDALSTEAHRRSAAHIIELSEALDAEFGRRAQRVSGVLLVLGYIVFFGALYMIVSACATFAWLFSRRLKRLQSFALAFHLVQTHLT
ncbi:Sensory domain found in PocR [Carpediemonas membranifera]|uniref:Sensory domain found in PocR n=1 Tax=Carpediemonas membranifera TaxID=201153 RepID=A0A8J6E3R4_9EUKA|nr:Sensory domain found in PocR [Carpediemonas membranifera]|eukprot:KAG9396278.1 Sensory domain found in PocR [Carpediemonas membranifera]